MVEKIFCFVKFEKIMQMRSSATGGLWGSLDIS